MRGLLPGLPGLPGLPFASNFVSERWRGGARAFNAFSWPTLSACLTLLCSVFQTVCLSVFCWLVVTFTGVRYGVACGQRERSKVESIRFSWLRIGGS